MSYTHLTLNERKYLQQLLSEGYSIRKIASILERSPSTISREIKRNRAAYKPHRKPDNKYWYNHWHAQNLYIIRRRDNRRTAITPDSDSWNFIVKHLKLYWSPEEIRGRWHKLYPDRKQICVSTVYRYIKREMFPNITVKRHLRRHGKRLMPKTSCYNTIQPDRIIPQWIDAIKFRLRLGDWEGDTIYGGIGKGLLVSLVDRKSRYLKLRRISSRNAKETADAICDMLQNLPVESISLDNGSEFAEFQYLEEKLDTLVYFAEPHKPWQRGTNENTNDIVRFFFPKGFDFRTVSDDIIQFVEDLINNRPRKCLDWKTPAEVFFDFPVALA